MKSIPLTLLLGVLGLSWPAHGADKPNILWLVAEDFGQHLGCYGTKEVCIRTFEQEMNRMPNFALHERAHAFHDLESPTR